MEKGFLPIPPLDIPLFIAKITPGLNAIERPDGFTNDDVFEDLKHGRAFLFMLSIEGRYAGFTVLQEVTEYKKKRLHIWLTFSPSNQDILSVFDSELEHCAQSMGASSITFSSSRPAWQKVAPRHGFAPRETVYSRPVKTISMENQ